MSPFKFYVYILTYDLSHFALEPLQGQNAYFIIQVLVAMMKNTLTIWCLNHFHLQWVTKNAIKFTQI